MLPFISFTVYLLIRNFAICLTSWEEDSLTPAVYKYLDIGISVGHVSHVKIAIEDTRDNRIILPYATWKTFIDRREDIEQLLRSIIMPSSLTIQGLNMEFCKLYGTYKVKLSINFCI